MDQIISDRLLFNVASYTAIMRQKTILKTPAKKKNGLFSPLFVHLVWLYITSVFFFSLVESTLECSFLFNQFEVGSGLFSFSCLYVPFYNCAREVIFFLRWQILK